MAELSFNGTRLIWNGYGDFKATSGQKDHQNAAHQTLSDFGPIPEGSYFFHAVLQPRAATLIGPGQLDRREGIQSVPQSLSYNGETYDLAPWGPDRVRLSVTRIDDPRARHRGGFYLHDSVKGYSHGCVEVEGRFFTQLRAYTRSQGARKILHLRVQYPAKDASTYGGTDLVSSLGLPNLGTPGPGLPNLGIPNLGIPRPRLG